MAATASPLKGRIHYIDGLRAVAVLMVVVHHAAKYGVPFSPPIQHALMEGAHGVDLFFVISGFVLSHPFLVKLHEQGKATFDVATYLAHRFVRILPPYYFAIAVCWLILYAVTQWQLSMPWGIIGPHVTPLEVLKQMVFMDQQPQLLNGAFWSLAVEFRWYFVFPLLLLLWTKSPRAFAVVGLAFVFMANFTRAASLDVFILPGFMLGIVAAEIEVRQMKLGRLAALVTVLALCVALLLEPKTIDFYNGVQWAWQLLPFSFVVAAGAIPWLRKALGFGPLVAIGLVSYSIYLIHEPLIGLVLTNTPYGFFAAVAVGVAAGALFWVVFERPFMATPLKGKLTGMLQPPLARLLSFLGISTSMELTRTPAKAAEAAAVAEEDAVQAAPAPEVSPVTSPQS